MMEPSVRPAGADDFIPAERHRALYRGMTPPRRANYARGPQNQPALEQKIPGVEPLGPKTLIDDETILNRLRMAKAVDESLGQILPTLERRGELDQTTVIFTSDHGYFYGEHYLGHERRLAYEETIRIPMLIRYPRMFRAGSKPEGVFLSVDVAKLCLQRVLPPPREDFLIEYFSDKVFPRIRNMGYQAVRTRRWKYIHYRDLSGADELYDLQRRPLRDDEPDRGPASAADGDAGAVDATEGYLTCRPCGRVCRRSDRIVANRKVGRGGASERRSRYDSMAVAKSHHKHVPGCRPGKRCASGW